MTWLGIALCGLFVGGGLAFAGYAVGVALLRSSGRIRLGLSRLADSSAEAGAANAAAARYVARVGAGIVHLKREKPKPEDPRMSGFRAWASSPACLVRDSSEMAHLEACYAIVAGLEEGVTKESREDAETWLRDYGIPHPGGRFTVGV
jgi:hypothetical protein